MKSKNKIWIALILIGSILIALGLYMGTGIGIYVSNTGVHIIGKEIYEEKQVGLGEIAVINIQVEDINILFEEANNYGIEIRTNNDDDQIQWNIENKELKINQKKNSKFRIFSFDFSFMDANQTPYIKIYLPKGEQLTNININTEDSNIKASNINVAELIIDNKYGKVELLNSNINKSQIKVAEAKLEVKEVVAEQMNIDSKYGKVNLSEITSRTLQVQKQEGNIELNKIKTEEMKLQNNEGKITGNQIESIMNNIETREGKIEIEGELTGDSQIISSYGLIKLNLKKEKSYYNLDLATKEGNITIDEEKIKGSKIYTTNQEGGKTLKINTRDGNILMYFNK